MQGQAVVDLDHPEHYNAGKGTLNDLLVNHQNKERFAHLKSSDGQWTAREDVLVRYQTPDELKSGKLSIGFTGYGGSHHFGPELQFGHVVGDALEEPVLLIKAAWGGKSLHQDFRPPSAGGEVGQFYSRMIEEFKTGIDKAPTDFPQLKNHEFKIAGFVWMQGWNDMCDEEATKNYAANLVHLINDVRDEFDSPKLPCVIGELGNMGAAERDTPMQRFRRQQELGCGHRSFVGNVDFVPTNQFARAAQASPNPGHGHHWFGNAESYFLIGDALGQQMMKMLKRSELPKVLLLGDSISMGYHATVVKNLPDAFVARPMRTVKNAENCAGTTNGVEKIDDWLSMGDLEWDVIHFNFGLHDLKHVDPDSKQNSNDPNNPPQADLETYRAQLNEIVEKLEATGAKLIFATTTPVPEGGVRPYRAIDAPDKYNQVAFEIMQARSIEVNDLYSFVNDTGQELLMKPVDVHFKPAGSVKLGEQVAATIRKHLTK